MPRADGPRRCAARVESVGSLDRTPTRRRRLRVTAPRESRALPRARVRARLAFASVSGIVGFPSRFPFSTRTSIGGGSDPLVFFRFLNRHGCVLFRDLGRSFLKKMTGTRGCFPGGYSDFLVFYLWVCNVQ